MFGFGKKTTPVAVEGSAPMSVNGADIKAVLLHALFVAGAAGIGVVVNDAAHLDFGVWTATLVPVISSALVMLQKYLSDNSK